MAYTLIRLNHRYNYTGQAHAYLSQCARVVKANCDKVYFVANYALMRIVQKATSKQTLQIPAIVQKTAIEGSEENLDQAIKACTDIAAEKIKAPVFEMVDPIKRGFVSDDDGQKWLQEHHLPSALLRPEFRNIYLFIRDSQLFQQANYYNHPIVYDQRRNEILIKVNKVYRPSAYILRNFKLENRSSLERAFLPPFIVCRETNRRYAYLENGLTQHDSERSLRSYKTLAPHERPATPQVIFKFCLNGDFDSAEGVENFDHHTWCDLALPSGRCYSFGLFGQGVAQSPDPTEFSNRKRVSLTFNVDYLDPVFKFIQRHRRVMAHDYHFSKYNCASFIKDICILTDIDASEKMQIKDFNYFVMQIRLFAVSNLLAHSLREKNTKDKIIALKEIAGVVHALNKMPITGKKLINAFSLDRSLESVSIKNQLQDAPQTHQQVNADFAWFKSLINSTDLESLTQSLTQAPISADQLKELLESTLQGSTRQLTYKLFNFFNAVYTNYSDYEFCAPHVLFKNLDKQKSTEADCFLE